jgi:hypothetical protein
MPDPDITGTGRLRSLKKINAMNFVKSYSDGSAEAVAASSIRDFHTHQCQHQHLFLPEALVPSMTSIAPDALICSFDNISHLLDRLLLGWKLQRKDK